MPAVPLMWALRLAGHEVMFLGQPDVTGMAAAAGLPTVTVGPAFDAGRWFRGLLTDDRRPIEAGVAQVSPYGWSSVGTGWARNVRDLLPHCLEFARRWRPDLVVTDPLEYCGLIVGGVQGVPVVHHRWSAEPMSEPMLATARDLLAVRVRAVGLRDLPEPDLVLDPFPESWAIPGVKRGLPVRPVPYNGGGVVPLWTVETPAVRRVCVTFGLSTMRLNLLPLVRHIVDALADLAAGSVVTLGRADRERLGPVPPSVRLVDPVPIGALLSTCAVVVHHGGGGTTVSALTAGVPQLLLPQVMDQNERCERIEASGAALRLATAEEQNDPLAVRAALRALLDRPTYRRAAADLRDEVAAFPTPADLVGVLERLADR
jgi:hypothetical protein